MLILTLGRKFCPLIQPKPPISRLRAPPRNFRYNFHLFPRDEFRIGMPSYSFLCQSSYLTSMVQEGFDINACIYDGISYLSRAQESAVKYRTGNPFPCINSFQSPSPSAHAVADSIFVERIRFRVRHWLTACRDSDKTTEDALLSSLRKLVSGSELYGSRPCLSIDVCSDRQVKLALEMLMDFDEVVPLPVPAKNGEIQAIRVILMSSQEDKHVFKKELENMEKEHIKRVRGFREVIDLVSASQKPVVAHNSLNEFAFVHEKFLGQLPSTVDEFRHSLHLVFPHTYDINHLMKEIGCLRTVNNLGAAISYLKRRFSVPIDMEVPQGTEADEFRSHYGYDVLSIGQVYAKLCSILKIDSDSHEADRGKFSSTLECSKNIFNPYSSSYQDPSEEDVKVWTNDTHSINSRNLVFVWGFRSGLSSRQLKSLFKGSHDVFTEEFDVRLVDKHCAVVIFRAHSFTQLFLEVMSSGGMCNETLKEMISEGVRAAGYSSYKRVCQWGLWEASLADALDKTLDKSVGISEADLNEDSPLVYWNSDEMINLDDL